MSYYSNDYKQMNTAKAMNYMTPNKSIVSIDTTISHAKLNKNFSFSTPRSKSSNHDDNSLLTPIIKKSKRRDCTPSEIQESLMFIDDNLNSLSKNIFLENLEKIENTISEDNELITKIKGSYLLNCLENSGQNLYQTITQDGEIFAEVLNLVTTSFFEGFNSRSELFFKFMVNKMFNFSLRMR